MNAANPSRLAIRRIIETQSQQSSPGCQVGPQAKNRAPESCVPGPMMRNSATFSALPDREVRLAVGNAGGGEEGWRGGGGEGG